MALWQIGKYDLLLNKIETNIYVYCYLLEII